MSEMITMQQADFLELIDRTSQAAVRRTLESVNMLRSTITYAEVKALFGNLIALKARMSPNITWYLNDPAKPKSGAFCMRSELDRWHTIREMQSLIFK